MGFIYLFIFYDDVYESERNSLEIRMVSMVSPQRWRIASQTFFFKAGWSHHDRNVQESGGQRETLNSRPSGD